MSGGIWFATVGVYPGLEGVALLLPTKRFRGFVAFLVAGGMDEPATSGMVSGNGGAGAGEEDWIEAEVERTVHTLVALSPELDRSSRWGANLA